MAPRSAYVASLLGRHINTLAGTAMSATRKLQPVPHCLSSSIAPGQILRLRRLASSGHPATWLALPHPRQQRWKQPLRILQNPQCLQARCLHIPATIEATVNTTASLISEMHSIGHTPWWMAIPLVALGVNILFRLPFSAQSRFLSQKQARLTPVVRAWAVVHAGEAQRKNQRPGKLANSSQLGPTPDFFEHETAARVQRTSKTVTKTFGLQTWRLYGTMLTLPPWLVVIEALRRLCGAPIGLLGLVFHRVSAPETPQAGATVKIFTKATAVSSADSSLAATASSSFSDPSLTTGGALWFSDLTVSDPYYILPVALSAMLVVNVFPSTDAEVRAVFGLNRASFSLPPPSLGRVALQRTLLLLSVSAGFFTLHFPSAIHLYWLSSAMSSFAITHTLNAKVPLPKARATASRHMDLPWIQPLKKK